MTDDIVERLRNGQGIGINLTLCREAADEIERLRAQVAALREALEEIEGVRPFCCEVSDNLQGIARAALEEK